LKTARQIFIKLNTRKLLREIVVPFNFHLDHRFNDFRGRPTHVSISLNIFGKKNVPTELYKKLNTFM
jgi:hypothetical protein